MSPLRQIMRPLRMSLSTPSSSSSSEGSLDRLRKYQRALAQRRARLPTSQDRSNSSSTSSEKNITNQPDSKGKASEKTRHKLEDDHHQDVAAFFGQPIRRKQTSTSNAVSHREARGSVQMDSNVGDKMEKRKATTNSNAASQWERKAKDLASSIRKKNLLRSDLQGPKVRTGRGRTVGALRGEGSDVIDEQSNNRVVKPVIKKEEGTLPWKKGRASASANGKKVEQVNLVVAMLSEFTTDPGLPRGDGKLPKKDWRRAPERKSGSFVGKKDVVQEANCDNILESLNDLQKSAVIANPGQACLVLAGPGSGKTRVLTHRIAYLVGKYGVSPFNILAVTFTNKAAAEMRDRVSKLLGMDFAPDWSEGGPRLNLGTFHSCCARILRKYADEVGISSDFDICDTSDSRGVVSKVLRELETKAPDQSTIRMTTAMISKLKNEQANPDDSLQQIWSPRMYRRIHELRNAYDKKLRSMNKLDFDDLLVETRNLLKSNDTVLEELQNKFEHVLVDEWQDTNNVQFDIVSMLAGKMKNLFVVGDADQSIYKFRGADIRNLDRFNEVFPQAARIALECNYRSSAAIVGAAQAVIEGDRARPDKKMTTVNSFGNKVRLEQMLGDRGEAYSVISRITRMLNEGAIGSLSDVAILYRTNSQSRLVEEACVQKGIAYILLSGTKFYDRQEIRDLVAYLKLLSNPADDDSFRRIVNVPPRGIGRKTVEDLEKYSSSRNLHLLAGLDDLISNADNDDEDFDPGLRPSAIAKLGVFHGLFSSLRKNAEKFYGEDVSGNKETPDGEGVQLNSLLEEILKATNYEDYVRKAGESDGDQNDGHSEKAQERVDNIKELLQAASRHSSLRQYLESATLMERNSDDVENKGDAAQKKANAISLMTLHGGKGLEYEAVFIIGAEDNIIPLSRATTPAEIAEERRLLYVGMTRAKQYLNISWRSTYFARGVSRRRNAGLSRFLEKVPSQFVERITLPESSLPQVDEPASNYSTGKPRWKRRERGTSQIRANVASAAAARQETTSVSVWRVGDSVRCEKLGRGTVLVGGEERAEGASIEVLFVDGTKKYINTKIEKLDLLFSPTY